MEKKKNIKNNVFGKKDSLVEEENVEKIIKKSFDLYKNKQYEKSLKTFLDGYKLSKKKGDKHNEVKCLKKIFSLSSIHRLSQEYVLEDEDKDKKWILNYKNIKLGKTIDSGSYSIVKHAFLRLGKNEKMSCAVKEINMERTTMQEFKHEVRLMYECNHPNILKAFGCFWRNILYRPYKDEYHIPLTIGYIAMEFCEKGSLFHYLSHNNLSTQKKMRFIKQIGLGMLYLHTKKKIIHRDLKPKNILIDCQETIKICDFGCSKHTGTMNDDLQGTVGYVAPELVNEKLKKKDYHPNLLDIYSFGILIWVIWTQTPPYLNIVCNNKFLMLNHIIEKNRRPDVSLMKRGHDKKKPFKMLVKLMKRCWHKHPHKRPSSFGEILILLNKIKF